MTICAMKRRCIHCHRAYTYNPSVGDFGIVCKHCHKPQIKFQPKSKRK